MDEVKFQIGKNGVTDGIIGSFLLAFKTHKQIRISALKASGRDSNTIEKMAEEIELKLAQKSPSSYKHKVIGFTIIMRKTSALKK